MVIQPLARWAGFRTCLPVVVLVTSSSAFAQTSPSGGEAQKRTEGVQAPSSGAQAEQPREQSGEGPEATPDASQSQQESEKDADETEAAEAPPVGTFEDVKESQSPETAEVAPTEDPEAESTSPAPALVARPESEQKTQSRPVYIAPPRDVLTPERAAEANVDRRESVPGDYVARPLTLPGGTFLLSFNQGFVLLDDAGFSGNSPAFALGITPDLEVGISAPLRFDQGSGAWSVLEPLPHLGVTWEETDGFEVGTRVAVLIPTSSRTDMQLQVKIPVLFRPHKKWRIDLAALSEVGFEESTEVSLGALAAASVQPAPWFFTGAEIALDVGVTNERTTGVDAALLAGLTYQSRGHANVDFVTRFFAENMGGGREGQLSDGMGLLFSVSFFPELY